MDRLDHLLITRIAKSINSVKDRARVSCISRDWRDCVGSSWTEVEIHCHDRDRNEVQWLVNQLDGNPGVLHVLSVRFRGGKRRHDALALLHAPAFLALTTLRLCSQDLFSDEILHGLAKWLPNLKTLHVRAAYRATPVVDAANNPPLDLVAGQFPEKFVGYTGFTQLKELTIHALRPRETHQHGGCLASALTGLTNLEKLILKGENAVLESDEGGVLRSLLDHLTMVEVSVGRQFWEKWTGPVKSDTLESASLSDARDCLPFSQPEPLPPLHCPRLHTLSTNLLLPMTGLPVCSLRSVQLNMMRVSDISTLQPLYGCTHLSMTLAGVTPTERLQCQYFKLGDIPLPNLEDLHVHFDDVVYELKLSPELSSLTRLRSLRLGGVVWNARGVEFHVVGGQTTQMPALKELRIHALRVVHTVLASSHLRHLSLFGSGEFCMDTWPYLANLSGLTRLDLLHVPGPDKLYYYSGKLVLPSVTILNIQFGYEPYQVFDRLKGRAGIITRYNPAQWERACEAILRGAYNMPTLRALKLVAGMDTMSVDLAKLSHLNHLSVAGQAITLTIFDCTARVPPFLDVMSVRPVVLDGAPYLGLSPECVIRLCNRSGERKPVWRLKTGFEHDLDLGLDTLDEFLTEWGADQNPSRNHLSARQLYGL